MAITAGTALNATPASQKQTLATAYIDFTDGSTGWEQQYLPDLMAAEAEVFGNRTISGFLAQVGAEEAMSADQVVWSEQGRLHVACIGSLVSNTNIFTVVSDSDGNVVGDGYVIANHGLRIHDVCLVANAGWSGVGQVVLVNGAAVTITPYGAADWGDAPYAGSDATFANTQVVVIGSEYAKGTAGQAGFAQGTGTNKAITPTHVSHSNKPIIMKDYYEISGSDASQVGWVEVTGEEGQNGYLWYLKAAGDTKARFNDYVEMMCIESEKTAAASHIVDAGDTDDAGYAALGGLGANSGTEGLFAAIEARGNLTSGVTGVNAATDLAEFDAILAEFDKQGAIEENMMFVNRATSLAMDDMLASMNSYGAGGTSYGVFDNSEDMALNLGFSGFRRGSYDFYKSDWKYLNDSATRGGINTAATSGAVRGVIVPAGVSSVYDQNLGKNLKRPFLHVRYRASQTESRKMKTWTTGSVGAVTSDLDAMQMHFLSERCLITQGANNFMLMK
jgi:hypothetical protein